MPELGNDKTLEKDLIRLMVVRVMLISLFLGVSAVLHFTQKFDFPYSRVAEKAHYVLIASVYFLSIIWAINFPRTKDKRKLTYVQLAFDSIIVTCMVYITGGVQSIFSLLYFLVIMSAGFILDKRAGYIFASLCGILYGGLGDLQYYNIISPIGYFGSPLTVYPEIMFFYRIVVHIFAFYLVAFLTGHLSQRLSSSVKDYKKLQNLTNTLLKNLAIGIVLVDQKGDFLYTNPKAKEVLSEGKKEIGARLISYIKEMLDKIKVNNSKHLYKWELLEVPFEQNIFYYQIMASEIVNPGEGSTAYAFYIQDVTETKALENELKRMENLAMVGGLAAKVAHEVRNPLAVINTVVEMLQQEEGHMSVKKRLFDIAFREIGRIQSMIRDLLMLARPKKPFIKEIIIHDFLEEFLAVIKGVVDNKKKVSIATEIPKDFKIRTDPELLRQALTNIVINAFEATGDDGVVLIELKTITESPNKSFLSMSIKDNGPGFSESALKNLFVPFFTTKEKGSGLGLVISKGILESLNGTLTVENIRPRGCQVTITLPVD